MGKSSSSQPHFPPPDEENQKEPVPPSWGKRLCKWGILLVAAIALLLVCAALALQYYFPAKTLQPIIEKELSRVFKLPVTIAELDVSIFHGIEIRDARIGSSPLLKIPSLILDYDLTRLLLGRIIINRVVVDKPAVTLVSTQGIWNFQSPSEPAGKTPPPSKKVKPTDQVPLPLAVDLKQFSINNIILDMVIDDQVSGHLEGLDVQARGRVSSEELDLVATLALTPRKPANFMFSSRSGAGLEVKTAVLGDLKITARDINHIDLTGKFQTENSQVRSGQVLLSPDMNGEWDMALSMEPERLQIKNLLLHLGKENQIKLAGEIQDFHARPEFKLTLQEAVINIKEALALAGDWAKPARADGVLRVAGMEVAGRLPGFKLETVDVARGTVTLEDFSAAYSPASVAGVRVDLSLQEAKLVKLIPQQLVAQARVSMSKGRFGDVSINSYNQRLQVANDGSSLTRLMFSASAENVKHPKWGKTGLRVEGAAEGNLPKGDLDMFKMTLGVGAFLNASLQGQAKDFGKKDFQADHSLNLDLGAFLTSLPADARKRLGSIKGVAGINTHVQGVLDANFQPQSAFIKTDVRLREVDLQLADPSLGVKNLNLNAVLPAEYGAEKGIKIPPFDLNARFQKIQTGNNWAAGPAEYHGRMTLPKPFRSASDTIPFKHHAKLTADAIGSADAKLAGLRLETNVNGDFFPAPNEARNVKLSGDLSFKKVEGFQKFKAGKSRATFTVEARDSSQALITLKSSLLSPSLKRDDFDFGFGEVRLDSRGRWDRKNGNMSIDRAKIELPDLLRLDIKGQAQKWGDTFAVEGKLSQLRLSSLPVKLANGTSMKIAGSGSLDFSAKGSRPMDLKSMKLPVEASARLALVDVSFDDREQLKAQGLNYSASLDLKNNLLKVSGRLAFEKLFKKDWLGDAWLEPEFNYRYTLTDWNKLVLDKHQLVIRNRGVMHTLAGRVEGFRNFFMLNLPFSPAEASKRLDVALVSTALLKMDQPMPVTRNVKADGAITSRLALNLVPGKEIVLDGELGFDRFNCSIEPSLKVNGVNGRFPFNKKFELDKKTATVTPAETLLVSQKGFFSQLRDFSIYKNTLRISSIDYDSYKLARIGMDLLYKDNHLAAEKFILDLLKGSLGGQLFLTQTAQGPMLNFSTEFAGLDFNDLVGGKTAQSQIDGNIQLGLKVNQGNAGGEKISIDQIEAKIAITRIGDEALDRILLFLDPGESKPAIVDTRAKLKLATPQRVLIGLENGNLSVEIWLKSDMLGGVVKAPELKRVPVTSLKRFQLIADRLQALAGIRTILRYLAARGIEFNEEGGLALF